MGTATKLIADDRRAVSYRPRFARLVGSVLSAILLQQMIYWWDRNGEQPFFKFKEPCKNKEYRTGDSWCEELGFTRYEFDSALALIGTKIVKGISKNMAMEWEIARLEDFPNDDAGFVAGMQRSIQHLIVYWTDSNRRTWYWVNSALLDKVAEQLYLDKSDLQLYLGKVKRPLYLLSEMNSGNERIEEHKDSPQPAKAVADAPDPKPDSVTAFGNALEKPSPPVAATPSPIRRKARVNVPPNPVCFLGGGRYVGPFKTMAAAQRYSAGHGTVTDLSAVPTGAPVEPAPTERPRDAVFDAIALGSFNMATVPGKSGGRIGKLTAGVKECADALDLAADLTAMYGWYKTAHLGLSAPSSVETICKYLAEYRAHKAQFDRPYTPPRQSHSRFIKDPVTGKDIRAEVCYCEIGQSHD